eukprot:TRINITY_DN7481_c0_g1_i3.p2 TRINITY_DN7481_c0_g1~~TRINITY_DN7481_c0_g1_i3.p2  ORF type:complete len:131 (-),score=12.79 TRINITY_DN7481_c0_g1_i3:794-1186(-)
MAEPAVIVVDAAPQHALTAETAEMRESANIYVRQIPPKMTHCFQPADHFVIRNLKVQMNKAWRTYVSQCVATLRGDDALNHLFTSSLYLLKKVKYHIISRALGVDSKNSVVASWRQTGIPHAVLGMIIRG